MDTIAGIFLIAGSMFLLIGGIGVLRFPDVYARMHAAAKGPTLALLLIAIGVGLTFRTMAVAMTVTLVVLLQLLTAPVGSHLIGRSVHKTVRPNLDAVDDLARDESAEEADESH